MAKEDSSASESSLSRGKVSCDPDIESQPSVRRTGQTQPEVQASSFPVTLDCTHTQRCSTAPTSLPLHCPPPPPPLQPPSYAQSLAKSQFCHPETLSDPPAYTPALVVTRPQSAAWTAVPTGSRTICSGTAARALRRIQSFTSTTSSSGAAHIDNQKLSRPTSAGQGKVGTLHCCCSSRSLPFYRTSLLSSCISAIRRSSSSKLKSNSTGTLKELNSLSAQAQSNQQAFISALQKLADKQVARHYASSSHINLLTQHVSSPGFFFTSVAHCASSYSHREQDGSLCWNKKPC